MANVCIIPPRGANCFGCGSAAGYNGAALVKQSTDLGLPVIFVTIKHVGPPGLPMTPLLPIPYYAFTAVPRLIV